MGLVDFFQSFFSPGGQPIPLDQALLDQALMSATLGDEQDRLQVMARAWKAYNEDYPQPLEPTADGSTDAIIVNHAKIIVAIGTAFLFSPPPTWELIDGTAEDKTWLTDCLEAEEWPRRLLDLGTNGAVCGTPYVRLYPPRPGADFPRLRVLDPECMTIKWDPRDSETVTAYWWQYNTVDPVTHRPRVDRQRVERILDATLQPTGVWEIIDEHCTPSQNAREWIEDGRETWPYPWPPIDHCKHGPAPNQVYGDPAVTDGLIALINERNRNLSNRQRIDRFHGSPLTTLTGATIDALDRSPDAVIELPENAKLEMHYPKVDSKAAEGMSSELFEAICEVAATPSIVLGRPEAQSADPSGVALRVKMWPAVIATETRRTLYAPLLKRVLAHLLELGDRSARRVALTWPELLPTDPLTERRVLTLDIDAGALSTQSYAEKIGIDWATEAPRLAQEAAAAQASLDRQNAAKTEAALAQREITTGIRGE